MATERRRHTRITPKGTAIAHAGEHAQRGRILNLGMGGVLVRAARPMPASMLAQPVRVELRFDGQEGAWLEGTGTITRIEPDAFAVALEEIGADLHRAISGMSRSSLANDRVMNVVLIDADVGRRTQMMHVFREVGCTVVEASSSLEAVVRLGESSFEFDLIAIADSTPSSVANELRTFVEREHPDTKLVTIGDGVVEPFGAVHWLSSANGSSDMPARIREMLGRPDRPPTRS